MPTPEAPTPRSADATATTPAAGPSTEGRRPRTRRTKVLAAGLVLGAAALAAGGVAAATAGDDDASLTGADRDRATEVAVERAGGGTVTEADVDDDGGYDVEVRRDDGTEVDIDLADDFTVIGEDREDPDGGDDDGTTDRGSDDRLDDDGRTGEDGRGIDDDDVPLTGTTLDQASKAAIAKAGGGTVTDAHVGDDGAAYEVEVTLADGTEIDVDLDAAFAVIRTDIDRPDLDD